MALKQTARLEARVPVNLYASLKQAAQLKGSTITDFVVNALHDAAHRTIEEASIFRLSAGDQLRFAQALIDPPPPNEALVRAADLHAENVDVR